MGRAEGGFTGKFLRTELSDNGIALQVAGKMPRGWPCVFTFKEGVKQQQRRQQRKHSKTIQNNGSSRFNLPFSAKQRGVTKFKVFMEKVSTRR